MGINPAGYYYSGVDDVVANAEGVAATLTARGRNNEYLEVRLQEKIDEPA